MNAANRYFYIKVITVLRYTAAISRVPNIKGLKVAKSMYLNYPFLSCTVVWIFMKSEQVFHRNPVKRFITILYTALDIQEKQIIYWSYLTEQYLMTGHTWFDQ